MKLFVALPLCYVTYHKNVLATEEKFIGQLAGAMAGGATQALLARTLGNLNPAEQTPPPPTPEEVAAEQALEKARQTSDAATGAKDSVKSLKDSYAEMETDLAVPLAQHTAELKAERLRLMHRLSVITSQLRQLYDSLHPDLVNSPLVIVAKTADDDKRNEANKLDAKGKRDAISGIVSPCAAFHEEREAEKQEIEYSKSHDVVGEEARTLAMMAPQERLEYDRTMAAEQAAKVQELQDTIAYERKKAGVLTPTQRLLLGALAPAVPHVPMA